MATLTKALRSMAGAGTVDRMVLAASILILAVIVLQVRSTVAGMDVEVALGQAETVQR